MSEKHRCLRERDYGCVILPYMSLYLGTYHMRGCVTSEVVTEKTERHLRILDLNYVGCTQALATRACAEGGMAAP